MFNPTTAPHYNVFLRSLETVPPPTPLEIKAALVGTQAEINGQWRQTRKNSGGGLMVPPDTYMVVHRGLVISSAAQHRLPAIFTYRQFAREGALITYGPETTSIFHRAASYVDRNLERRQPRRSAGTSTHEVRVGHQSQNSSECWPPRCRRPWSRSPMRSSSEEGFVAKDASRPIQMRSRK